MKNSLKIFFLSLSILLFSCSEASESIQKDNESNPSVETEILRLINEYRTSKRLATLSALTIVKTQTDIHTDYMIAKGRISHDDFNNRADYLKQNAKAKSIAENVASGYTSAKAVVDGWIASDGHRKNMEGNFSHFHVTAKQNNAKKWYYTNIFIKQ